MENMGHQMEEFYFLRGRRNVYSLGLVDEFQDSSWMDGDKQALSLKISSNTNWPGLGSRKMAAYTKLESCCVDGKVWSCIKVYDVQNYGLHSIENLGENYEGARKVNKTWSSPKRPLFLHALSFDCTTKLCINFLNQFSVYFHI